MMFGVWINAMAIIIGAVLGIILKRFITERISAFVEPTLGFCTIVVGLKMAMQYQNVLILLCAVGLGGFIGVVIGLQDQIERGSRALQKIFFKHSESSFAKGLVTSSIIYCVGGMAVVGSIQSGVLGNHEVLITKALLDGICNIVLASLYGIGTAFSAIPVFLYQGSIVLLAGSMPVLKNEAVIHEISGVGGVLIMMIGLNLSKISRISIGNYLPAMLLIIIFSILFVE